MTELKLTPTERMWMAAGKLDDARHSLMEAVRLLDGEGMGEAAHRTRFAVLATEDAQEVITVVAQEDDE